MFRLAHKPSRFLTTRKSLIALALLVAILVTSSPAPAAASAYGYQYWGGHSVEVQGVPIYIPGGQLYHEIDGAGLRVDQDGGDYISAGPLCDTGVRFTYGYGAYGFQGDIKWGCSDFNVWSYNYGGWTAPRGDACMELWAKEWRVLVARQCHYIH
jgi:hypothetical protein